jgi:hypothetical protein
MGILSGNPKHEPMHYGEVYAVWSYLLALYVGRTVYQTYANHAGDKDLRNFIHDKLENIIEPEIKQLSTLLKENGVGLPPSPPEQPKVDSAGIPEGARFSDNILAGFIASEISAGLLASSKIMGMSIREDIAAMFAELHAKKSLYGLTLLRMMKEKAWLVVPPLHKMPSSDE